MAMQQLLLLSGPVGAGKTAVATMLEAKAGFRRLSTSGYLRDFGAGLEPDGQRLQLQELGDRLDLETDYRWVVDDVAVPLIRSEPDVTHWLLDAVRKPRQVEHFRHRFGNLVRHAHLNAPEDVLRDRYVHRSSPTDTSYDLAISHPNELAARSLIEQADKIFNTSDLAPDQVVDLIRTMWEA